MIEDLRIKPIYDGFLFLAEAARNPPWLRSHRHRELEVNLVTQGSITYVTDGCRLTFPRRTLLWMFPAQEHQLVNRSADAQYYVAVFKPELIAQACRSPAYQGLHERRSPGGTVLQTLLEPRLFNRMVETMEATMDGSLDPAVLNRELGFGIRPGFRFEHSDPDGLNAGLHYLLLLSWRCRLASAVRGGSIALNPAVKKALHFLADGHWEYDFETLAHECGVSGAYLSRVFAHQVGVPLSRYHNSVRLSRFLEYRSRHPGSTITEAAFAAGFGSYAQFYKVFVSAYGAGPRPALSGKAAPKDSAEVDKQPVARRSLPGN
jgi:AraC-like DNA-binding protein